MDFEVEGRYFPNGLFAFTFAQIQADRMGRPVEVHVRDKYDMRRMTIPSQRGPTWQATAHPANYKRHHMVKQPPGLLAAAA